MMPATMNATFGGGMAIGKAADRREEWRARLRRFERSGQSVAEFCKAESVSVWSLYDWRRRLGSALRTRRQAAAAEDRFVDAGAMGAVRSDERIESGNGLELRIDLGGGLVLQILRR